MEPKDPMQILFDADLLAEFAMNKNFVDRHAREMGSRGRPRRFIRMNVERFVRDYFGMPNPSARVDQAGLLESLDKTRPFRLRSVPSEGYSGRGVILGRGGKKREGAAA